MNRTPAALAHHGALSWLDAVFAAMPPAVKHLGDVIASVIGIVWALATAVNVVTVLTVIWWTIRIYEMPTVQRWLRSFRAGWRK